MFQHTGKHSKAWLGDLDSISCETPETALKRVFSGGLRGRRVRGTDWFEEQNPAQKASWSECVFCAFFAWFSNIHYGETWAFIGCGSVCFYYKVRLQRIWLTLGRKYEILHWMGEGWLYWRQVNWAWLKGNWKDLRIIENRPAESKVLQGETEKIWQQSKKN